MNIARWSVSRPVAVTMRIAALVLLGIICFLRIPIDLLPRVELPVVSVNTNWPNTAPEEMEAQITRPVEQAVSTVPGLYSVSSNSELGQSQVRVTLNYGVDVDQAAVDVLQLVQRAQRSFPNDPTLTPPTVAKFDPNTFPVMIFGVSGIDDPVRLRTLLTNEISPILESAGGVAQVGISGGLERAIIVDVDPERLQAYGLTLADITRRIQAENISLPAGIAKEGESEYTIRSQGYFRSLEDAELVPITSFEGRQVLLRDIAKVRDEAQEQRVETRLNGESAVGITITKQGDANTIQTVENVKERIKEIQERYPELKFGIAYDQSKFVEKSIHLLQEHAIIGGTLAILAILFFLRNLRSTLVVALSIPISITSTFALMYFCGFTLNTISLSAMALATGLIVDDAIVILENIFRHIERDKKTVVDAAVEGPKEIMGAVVASTITVMVVFLPLFMVQGQSGQIFTQLALVVIFSIGISLLDAATVVPMLASRVLKADEIEELEHPGLRAERGKKAGPLTKVFEGLGRFFHAVDESYRNGLRWAIHHRMIVLAGVAAITLSVLPLWPMIGNETLPKSDSGDLNVRVKLPIGTALSTTTEKMRQVEQVLLDNPNVETVFLASGANIGFRGGVGNASSFEGSANVHLKESRLLNTEGVVKQLQKDLGKISGIRANVSPFDLVNNILGGNNTGIQIDIFGQDMAATTTAARTVMDQLGDIKGLQNLDLSVQEAAPELQWNVDRRKAEALGVSFSDIATAIRTATNGSLATYYQDGGYQYPIYVQVPVDRRRSVEDLRNLPIKPSAQLLKGRIRRRSRSGRSRLQSSKPGPTRSTASTANATSQSRGESSIGQRARSKPTSPPRWPQLNCREA